MTLASSNKSISVIFGFGNASLSGLTAVEVVLAVVLVKADGPGLQIPISN